MKNVIQIQYFKHPYAEFVLGAYDNKLCLCDFHYRKMRKIVDQRIQRGLNATMVEGNQEVIELTKAQLDEYFLGQRSSFEVPLMFVGSEFQKRVWRELLNVGYSETATYQDLAVAIGDAKATRAVASANAANAFAIIVPCHRIISRSGELTGYGGGLPLKRRLLELEQNLFI